jgi:hypothetical protein
MRRKLFLPGYNFHFCYAGKSEAAIHLSNDAYSGKSSGKYQGSYPHVSTGYVILKKMKRSLGGCAFWQRYTNAGCWIIDRQYPCKS